MEMELDRCRGRAKGDAYTAAIDETLTKTHTDVAPWTIVRSDDKRRARVQVIRHILSQLNYNRKSQKALTPVDQSIIGGPDLWHA